MSRIQLGQPGYVYILTNASMPGMLKIGATTDDPIFRAKQLSAATASPTPFVVVHSRWVDDCNAVEARLHDRFDVERVNDGREFFAVSIKTAVLALDDVADVGEQVRTPWAELFASFPDDGTARKLTEEEEEKCRELERSL